MAAARPPGGARPRGVALAALLLSLAAAGCSNDRYTIHGDNDAPPAWREPGPAATGPIERRVLPDDGFRDHLGSRDGSAGMPLSA